MRVAWTATEIAVFWSEMRIGEIITLFGMSKP